MQKVTGKSQETTEASLYEPASSDIGNLSGQIVELSTTQTEAKAKQLNTIEDIEELSQLIINRTLETPIPSVIKIGDVKRYMMDYIHVLLNLIIEHKLPLTSLTFGDLWQGAKLIIPTFTSLLELSIGNIDLDALLNLNAQPSLTTLTLGSIHDYSTLSIDAHKSNFPCLTSFTCGMFHGTREGNKYNERTVKALQILANSNIPTVMKFEDAFQSDYSNPVLLAELDRRCQIEFKKKYQAAETDNL